MSLNRQAESKLGNIEAYLPNEVLHEFLKFHQTPILIVLEKLKCGEISKFQLRNRFSTLTQKDVINLKYYIEVLAVKSEEQLNEPNDSKISPPINSTNKINLIQNDTDFYILLLYHLFVTKSPKLFQQSVVRNNADALFEYGRSFHYNNENKPDEQKALEYYEKACRLGNINALVEIGSIHATKQTPKDQRLATHYFEQGAKNGHPEACLRLDILLRRPDFKVTQRNAEFAATRGAVQALFILANIHLSQNNYLTAIVFFRFSAQYQKSKTAKRKLAHYFWETLQVPKEKRCNTTIYHTGIIFNSHDEITLTAANLTYKKVDEEFRNLARTQSTFFNQAMRTSGDSWQIVSSRLEKEILDPIIKERLTEINILSDLIHQASPTLLKVLTYVIAEYLLLFPDFEQNHSKVLSGSNIKIP